MNSIREEQGQVTVTGSQKRKLDHPSSDESSPERFGFANDSLNQTYRTKSLRSASKRNKNKFLRAGVHPGLADKPRKASVQATPAASKEARKASTAKVRAKPTFAARALTFGHIRCVPTIPPHLPTTMPTTPFSIPVSSSACYLCRQTQACGCCVAKRR
jgi:hypothetical protein